MADDAAAPEGELTEATENSPESSPKGQRNRRKQPTQIS